MSEKKCTGCLIFRKFEEFSKPSNTKDGLRHKCKFCRKEEYQRNKDREKAKNEEELIALQHYTNLQYLTPEDNLRKNDREMEVWLKAKEKNNE